MRDELLLNQASSSFLRECNASFLEYIVLDCIMNHKNQAEKTWNSCERLMKSTSNTHIMGGAG